MSTYRLKQLLEKRKQGTLYITPTEGGERSAEEQVVAKAKKEENNDKIFFAELAKIIKDNNRWLTFVFGIIGVLIAFLLVLVWIWQDNKEYIAYFLTGEGIGVSICIERLVHLYKQKRHSELLLLLYKLASTKEDKAKVIDAMLGFLIKEKK